MLPTIEEQGKTAAVVDAMIPAEIGALKEQIYIALMEQVAEVVTRRTAT